MSDDVYLLTSRELGYIKVNIVYKIFQSAGDNLWCSDIGSLTLKKINRINGRSKGDTLKDFKLGSKKSMEINPHPFYLLYNRRNTSNIFWSNSEICLNTYSNLGCQLNIVSGNAKCTLTNIRNLDNTTIANEMRIVSVWIVT